MKPRQIDIAWETPEPFALAVQTGTDGERVAQQQAQTATNRQLAELLQTQFPQTPNPGTQTQNVHPL